MRLGEWNVEWNLRVSSRRAASMYRDDPVSEGYIQVLMECSRPNCAIEKGEPTAEVYINIRRLRSTVWFIMSYTLTEAKPPAGWLPKSQWGEIQTRSVPLCICGNVFPWQLEIEEFVERVTRDFEADERHEFTEKHG